MRYFTLRELARLQTFPDSYVIPTVRSTGIRILGNAVPPPRLRSVQEGRR
ncbi:MAG: DNA cytosine methyltransferase [Dehalococcoidia bacterium]|nr:DNA cytosine methyltransferase [Dehalococcoidia bacterium]